jgi:hypothetical protein
MFTPQISWLTTPIEAASEGYDIAVEIAQPAAAAESSLPTAKDAKSTPGGRTRDSPDHASLGYRTSDRTTAVAIAERQEVLEPPAGALGLLRDSPHVQSSLLRAPGSVSWM